MRIAVIGGTGREGFGLAVRWARAGHSVVIGSRSPEKAEDAAARAAALVPDGRVRGAGNREAAAEADVITLTIPFSGHDAILTEIRPAAAGKPVIDTTVPLRRYAPPELDRIPAGSAAEHVQRLLPEAHVAAAMHSVSSVALGRLDAPLDGDVLYCGDAAPARQACVELIESLGMRALDAGALSAAAALESLAALIIGLNQRYRRRAIGLRFTGL